MTLHRLADAFTTRVVPFLAVFGGLLLGFAGATAVFWVGELMWLAGGRW